MSERARRRPLGRGLAALFGEAEGEPAFDPSGPRRLPIELIRSSTLQPRRRFDEAELETLSARTLHRLPYAAVADRLAALGVT